MNWLCTQIGAREHYAVPRALCRRGALLRLYTDLWATPAWRWLGRHLPALKGLAARHHPDLPADRLRHFNRAFLRQRLTRRRPRTIAEEYADHEELGRQFARRVARDLERSWPGAAGETLVYFGYATGCLETLQLLKDRGVVCIVDQADPARELERAAFEEANRRPGWQRHEGRVPESYYQRLADEWRLADRVIVNSDWSRQALVRQGVPAEKLLVVPVCYDGPEVDAAPRPRQAGRPLSVLWLGNVSLVKGIAYFLEAARALARAPLRFVVYGPVRITDEALRQAPPNVEFRGPVARANLSAAYREGDLFVVPTLSDGFAMTQLEAMAHGLPVIATPHCGRVVTDGEDGRIVPAADAAALAEAILDLTHDPARLARMGLAARTKVKQFSLEHLARRLSELEAALQPNG